MNIHSLPYIGVGLGYRHQIESQIASHLDNINWVEIISERYLDQPLELLNPIRDRCPIVPHGVELSIGTDSPIDTHYLSNLCQLANDLNAPWVSDHLAFTRTKDISIGNLTPLQFTDAVVRQVTEKARHVQEVLNRPFLLENITYYFRLPGELTEAEFLRRVVTEADCGILLDVANLYYNSQNMGYDPYNFLEAIPLERVIQVHLAGGHQDRRGQWVDSHSEPVQEPIWRLFEFLVKRSSIRGALIERDQNFPHDFSALLGDVYRAKRILEG